MEYPLTNIDFLSKNNRKSNNNDNKHEGEHHAGPDVWGNKYWNVLHVLSITGARDPEGMFLLLHSVLPEILPCAACRANHMLQMLESHGAELAKITILSKLHRDSPQRRFDMILFICQLRYNVTYRNIKCRKRIYKRLHDFFKIIMNISIHFSRFSNVQLALESEKKRIQTYGNFVPYFQYSKDLWFMIHLSSFILPPPHVDNQQAELNDVGRNHQFLSFSLFIKLIGKLLPTSHINRFMIQWCTCNGGLTIDDSSCMQVIDYKYSIMKIYSIIDNICLDRHKLLLLLFNIHNMTRRYNNRISTNIIENNNNTDNWNQHVRRYRELVFLTARYSALQVKNTHALKNNNNINDDNQDFSYEACLLLSKFTGKNMRCTMNIMIQIMRSLRNRFYPCNTIQIANVVDDTIKSKVNKVLSAFAKSSGNYKLLMKWVSIMFVMDDITNVILHSEALLKRSGDVCREYDDHEYNVEIGTLINYKKKLFKPETYDFLQKRNININNYHCLLTELNVRHYAYSIYSYSVFRQTCLSSIHYNNLNKNVVTNEAARYVLVNEHNNYNDTTNTSSCDAIEFDGDGHCHRPYCTNIDVNLNVPSTIGKNFKFCRKHIHYYSILNCVEVTLHNVEKHFNLIDSVYKWSAYVTREFLRHGDKEHNNIFIKPVSQLNNRFLHNIEEYRHYLPQQEFYNDTVHNEEAFNMSAVTFLAVYHMSMAIYSIALSKMIMVFFLSLVRTCAYKSIEITAYLKEKFPLHESVVSKEDCELQFIYHSLHRYIDRMFLGHIQHQQNNSFSVNTPRIIALHKKEHIVMKIMMNPNAIEMLQFAENDNDDTHKKKRIVFRHSDIKVCAWLKNVNRPIASTLSSIYVSTLPSRNLYHEIINYIKHSSNTNNSSSLNIDSKDEYVDVSTAEINLQDLYKFILYKLQTS